MGKDQRYYFWRDRSPATYPHYGTCFDIRSRAFKKERNQKKEQDKT